MHSLLGITCSPTNTNKFIQSIPKVNQYQTYNHLQNVDTVSFKGLLPAKTLGKLRMCVFDLDDTLLSGPQEIRNKVMNFSTAKASNGKKRILVYSSARSLNAAQKYIDNKTLIMPDYFVANNGLNIYKKTGNGLEEIAEYSNTLDKGFNKSKIRTIMTDICHKNMFPKAYWDNIPKDKVPDGQKEFRGSKITEYEVFNSPLNIYFMMAPGTYKKTLPTIKNALKQNKIQVDIHYQNFDNENLNNLERWFSPQAAKDMRNHAYPRLNKDKSVDVAIITAKSDKGRATEYLRNSLGLKRHEVYTGGDDVNDYSQTNKGYFFVMVANATNGLKNLMSKRKNNPRIVKATKPGSEGIWEVIG